MGLFKRKPNVDALELQVLRAEVVDLRGRLLSAERAKTSLEARLGSLDVTTNQLAASHASATSDVSQQLQTVLERLQAAEAHAARLDLLDTRLVDLEVRQVAIAPAETEHLPNLVDLAERVDELSRRVESVTDTPLPGIEELKSRVDHLAVKVALVDVLAERIEQLAARSSGFDALTERVQQLAGRGADIDDLARQLDGVRTRLQRVDELDTLGNRLDAVHELATNAATASSNIPHIDPNVPARVDQLVGELNELGRQLGSLDQHAARSDDATGEVRQRLTELDARVTELEQRHGATGQQLGQIAERVAIHADGLRTGADRAAGHAADVGALRTEMATRLDDLTRDLDEVAGLVAEVHARPVEAPIAASVIESPATTEAVDALRASQVRLANEQARYQIAFREDLATLAEQVRLLRGR